MDEQRNATRGGWLLEAIKNIAFLAISVAVIVVPRGCCGREKERLQSYQDQKAGHVLNDMSGF